MTFVDACEVAYDEWKGLMSNLCCMIQIPCNIAGRMTHGDLLPDAASHAAGQCTSAGY